MPDPLNNPNLQSYSLPKNPRITRFNPSKIIPYRLRFRTDYVSSTLDNNLLFEGLESYAGSPEQFQTPNPGVLMKANFKDLLENYVLETGFRMPVTFRGAEYYLTFDQKKARLDKRMALYRKTHTTKVDESKPGSPKEPFQVRNITLLGQYEVKYPFDPFFSLRGLATIRQDKALTLISDFPTLQTPTFNEQRAALRLSAVYDNTVNIDLNRRTGTRAKCWVEVVKKFAANVDPSPRVQFNRGVMTVLAWDARHYEPLGRHAILALRTAGATSFGSEKMLYLLGGIDNWILPRFNDNIPLPSTEGFAYQTLATNLHGFDQNIRNGNSFALINTELRLPLFRYLSKKPVMGNFWRNFLVVGFFDAGTAWQGRSPYRGDNPINSVVLTDGPIGQPPVVTIRVNYFRDPLVVGYGFGLRAQILGLYLRADYSWGIETRIVQKPIFQAALGLDF
jgi:hypothetical protein